MAPRISQAAFGLLDDEVTLFYGRFAVDRGWLPVLADAVGADGLRGRYHPASWLTFFLEYALFGPSARAWFVGNLLLLCATALTLGALVHRLCGSRAAALPSALSFVLSPPVFEAYYTLSKSEPLLVLWISVGLWAIVRGAQTESARRQWCWRLGALLAILWAMQTKETGLGILLAAALLLLADLRWGDTGQRPFLDAGGFTYGWELRLPLPRDGRARDLDEP